MTDLFQKSSAIFSPCRTWRYRLDRIWNPRLPPLVACMLNPSTADEHKNDATIERVQRRAAARGFGALTVVNIFAYRATDPRDMKAAEDPVGPWNDFHLEAVFEENKAAGGLVFGGWGDHAFHRGRVREVLAIIDRTGVEMHCLKVTGLGQPTHPLYQPYTLPFIPWKVTR